MGVCGLYLGLREVGTLSWEAEGSRLWVRAQCPCAPGMIYRVTLETDRGLRLLGVMLPDGQRFTLRKELPADERPRRAFIDRTLPGEEHLPGLPLALSAFSPGEEGLLQGAWMDTEYLLFPLRPGEACGAAHLLCLATPVPHGEGLYGVFCRRDGACFPLSDILRREDMIR